MRKKVGIVKRIFTLLLIFLLSINSFAAIVSDNDGSAFITKAEFDALKSSFQAQIDTYNQSIDSKIDGAIASYLSGIRMATTEILTNLYNSVSNNGGGHFWNFNTISNQNVTSYANVDVYYQVWKVWTIGANTRCWRIQNTWPGSGTIWTYKKYNGNNYLYGFYATAYPSLTVAGTTFQIHGAGHDFEFAKPIGLNKVTIGAASGNNYAAAGAENGFVTCVTSTVFSGFSDYSKYSASSILPTTDWGFLFEDEKTTKNLKICSSNYVKARADYNSSCRCWNTQSVKKADETAEPSPTEDITASKYEFSTDGMKLTDMISFPATLTYGSAVKLYEGCPVFKATNNGKVKFAIHASKSGTNLKIKKDKFQNIALTSESDIVVSQTIGTSDVILEFYVEKDKEYWLKSDTNDSFFKITSDIILTKEN